MMSCLIKDIRVVTTGSSSTSEEVTASLPTTVTVDEKHKAEHDVLTKELEAVIMAQTNWLMILNMPFQNETSRYQALQNILNTLGYAPPLFDATRDVLATDMLYTNKGGNLCNMAFSVCQRHYDHLMGAQLQKAIANYNKYNDRNQRLSIGRVLSNHERRDYRTAQALKRLIIRAMQEQHIENTNGPVPVDIVDKPNLGLRIGKTLYTLDKAAIKYGISADRIARERSRYRRNAEVNHCCAIHDNCYDLQLGRHWCDDNFCDCLKNATEPDICQATNLKCQFVKIHGQQAYHDAASYKEPPDFVKIFPKINGTHEEFQILYEGCPQVMLTIKSCSLMTNLCFEEENQEKCLFELDECVQKAAILQNSAECHVATEHIHGLLGQLNRTSPADTSPCGG
ncbi:hypothetical protein Aduo_008199 [Ancylostoma duodenale]